MNPDRVVVVGVGKTGESCIRYWHGKTEVFFTDTRIGREQALATRVAELRREFGSATFLSPAQVAEVADSDTVVYMSPGISMHDEMFEVVLACGSRLSSDVELFLEHVDEPIIGVTGTNGKSTTTDLVAAMLRSHGFVAGGNIGTPVLELLNEPAAGYVLELSSFQLERMRPPRLRCATVLNISEDHIDHHRSFDEYAAAKHRIYERCELAVYNNNDPIAAPVSKKPSIAINGTKDWCVRDHEVRIAGTALPTADISLAGARNHFNVVAAAALAGACGATLAEVVEVARTYKGLPHRMQVVGEIDDVRYVNDSKATNVAATLAAIESFGRPRANIVLLAGGEGKGAKFDALSESVRSHVKSAVLFGRDAATIAAAVGTSTEVTRVDSLDLAVERARQTARPGDVVLLSPACASFDMFANFEQRGDRFTSLVQGMAS